MREIALGQWTYFAWHLPAVALCALFAAVALAAALSLCRDDLTARERRLRFALLGWPSVLASMLSVVIWPYLAAFASVRVAPDGSWVLRNYLGVPVAYVPAAEARVLVGEDLGGLNLGSGRVRVQRADGAAESSVRISGAHFDALRSALGYPASAMHPAGGGLRTAPHRFDARGPRFDAALASR